MKIMLIFKNSLVPALKGGRGDEGYANVQTFIGPTQFRRKEGGGAMWVLPISSVQLPTA